MKEAKCPGLDLPLQLLSSFRRGRCSGGAPGLHPLRTRNGSRLWTDLRYNSRACNPLQLFPFHLLVQRFQQSDILVFDHPIDFLCGGFVVGVGCQVPFLLHVQPFFRIPDQMHFPGFPDSAPGAGHLHPFEIQDGFQEFPAQFEGKFKPLYGCILSRPGSI